MAATIEVRIRDWPAFKIAIDALNKINTRAIDDYGISGEALREIASLLAPAPTAEDYGVRLNEWGTSEDEPS